MPAKRRAHFTAHTRTNKRRLVQQISFRQRHARAWKSGRIYIFDIGVATEIANDLIVGSQILLPSVSQPNTTLVRFRRVGWSKTRRDFGIFLIAFANKSA